MIIACPACSTRYVVPDSSIGIEGRRVRCAKCRHSWFQEGPEMEAAGAPAQGRAAQAAGMPPPPPSAPQAAPPPTREAAPPSALAKAAPPPQPPPAPGQTEAPATPMPAAEAAPPAESAAAMPEDRREAPVAREALQSGAQGQRDEEGGAPEEIAREPEEPEPDPGEPFAGDMPEMPGIDSRAATSSSLVYDDDVLGSFDDGEEQSSFEYAPPFKPRRNWSRIGTYAGIAFAVLALGATAAISGFGLPDWLTARSERAFAPAEPELAIDFPANRQDRRTLPNGTEYFGASGKITNIGKTVQYVPSLLIALRDARGRIVYSWEVVPPKRELGPGEALTINEAVTDVPKSAVVAEIGWKQD